MHTVDELDTTDFEYRTDGQRITRSQVLPRITPEERVGVVMRRGLDGLGAGAFLLECVTAFYDHLGETTDQFAEYPDFYTFQTTDDPAEYSMLDVYPEHKNVAVEGTAEALLRAIADRAITILLVPEGPAHPPEIDGITRRSAKRWIEHCYLYAPDGRPDGADVTIRHPRQPADSWYETVADSAEGSPETDVFPPGSGDVHVTQGFRELTVEQALARLPPA